MSNQDDNVGVAPYAPSARKSIHNHESCIFHDCAEMGRYGLPPKATGTTGPPYQYQGTDEVDNVMSKFTRQTSPVPVRKKKQIQRKERRNSLQNSDPEFSDDDEFESDLLAKSLPANLPSYYCSNDIAHRSLPSDYRPQNNVALSDSRTERNVNNEFINGSSSTSSSFNEYVEEHQTSKSGNTCQPIVLALLVAFIGMATFCYKDFINLAQGTNSFYDEFQFSKDINYLGEKYKIQENSLLEVRSGISTILARNDTGSFIFVYNEKSVKFNNFQFSDLVQEIATVAAQYLRNNTMYNKPTVLHSSELDMQTHSEFMTKYRQEVAKTGVMLVTDMDKIPSSLAMAFHYFCDEYNPLVAKSAIFFTLNLAKCTNFSEKQATHNNVEKCLSNVWSGVPKDNIKPLLTRVVSVVIDVTDVL